MSTSPPVRSSTWCWTTSTPTGGEHIEARRAAHPGRLEIYYLPFHASWLNQIELWFATLSRHCLRLGDFRSGDDLADKILAFIETYNRLQAHPYRWTYTGDPLAA
jgi:hypothetical protein